MPTRKQIKITQKTSILKANELFTQRYQIRGQFQRNEQRQYGNLIQNLQRVNKRRNIPKL